VLGGEQSGHVIFSEYLFTGDGLATSLNVLRTMAATGRTLADLASDLTAYPQVLLNLRVHRGRPEDDSTSGGGDRSRRIAARRHGRLLVRYSGTEPLLRVMLEGQDQDQISKWGQEIIEAVKTHVGAAV
jgi:phosphoglucosamine mutase